MGMDVIGLSPTSKVGEYFRNNVWYWRPLAIYCEKIAPGLTNFEGWHFNEGKGLDGPAALHLADLLEAQLASGQLQDYADEYVDWQAGLADETCNLCDGTGERHDKYVDGVCNKCGGSGAVRPFETMYPFEVDNVKEWITFLRNCGGFEIR